MENKNIERLGKIIGIANQKGGVGKTTTTLNLAVALANEGKEVCAIDFDPQGHLTIGFGFPKKMKVTIKNMLESILMDDEFEPEEAIIHTDEGVDLLPSNKLLTSLDISLVSAPDREKVLKTYLNMIRDKYDYILIDCSPSLGMLTINALTAADSVLIPLETKYYGTDGLQELISTVGNIRKNFNPQLDFEGILYTIDNERFNDSKRIKSEVEEAYGEYIRVFNTSIPNLVEISNAPSKGQSVFKTCPEGKGAASYRKLALEVLNHERQ